MNLLKLFRRKPSDPFEEGLAKLRAGNSKVPDPPCDEQAGRESAPTGLRGGVYWYPAVICAYLNMLRLENQLPPWSVLAEKGAATPKQGAE